MIRSFAPRAPAELISAVSQPNSPRRAVTMLGSDAAPQPVTWTSACCLEEFALTLILMSAQGDAYPELTEVPEYEGFRFVRFDGCCPSITGR